MADTSIEALLQKTMGLKVTSIGQATLDRAIQRRMRILGVRDRNAYVEKLKKSVLELKELIEEVVIPETWFFRDRQPFDILTKRLADKWKTTFQEGKGLLRLLSVPCSTGEEPYSLAIALLKSGWPANRFQIHAVDISARSLARAKEGVYGEHSFRGGNLDYRDQFFRKINKHYQVDKSVRRKVHFHHGNILNPLFMESLGVFYIVFCRNVLIYFDLKARHQAITTLEHLLAEDGLLFVGHAEASLITGTSFTPAPYPQAFAFYKKKQKPIPAPRYYHPPKKTVTPTPPRQAQDKPGSGAATGKAEPAETDLSTARTLADQGKLTAAVEICEESLRRDGPSAEAFFLLGVINDAAGRNEPAIRYLRKAVYLHPNHIEALTLLSLLSERAGNLDSAQAYKQRVERLLNENASGQEL